MISRWTWETSSPSKPIKAKHTRSVQQSMTRLRRRSTISGSWTSAACYTVKIQTSIQQSLMSLMSSRRCSSLETSSNTLTQVKWALQLCKKLFRTPLSEQRSRTTIQKCKSWKLPLCAVISSRRTCNAPSCRVRALDITSLATWTRQKISRVDYPKMSLMVSRKFYRSTGSPSRPTSSSVWPSESGVRVVSSTRICTHTRKTSQSSSVRSLCETRESRTWNSSASCQTPSKTTKRT